MSLIVDVDWLLYERNLFLDQRILCRMGPPWHLSLSPMITCAQCVAKYLILEVI